MNTIPKVLAEGQLSNVKTTLYTVPASKYALVKFFSCFNTGATQTILIYANISGTSRLIARAQLLSNEFARIIEKEETLTLEAGDFIEAESTNASVVDFLITGAETI